jgi:hypothetical protein
MYMYVNVFHATVVSYEFIQTSIVQNKIHYNIRVRVFIPITVCTHATKIDAHAHIANSNIIFFNHISSYLRTNIPN